MHLDKPQLIFRGRNSVENRFQVHASWRDKPLKCLIVTKDLRLARELTAGIDAHLNVAAACYPSLSALERSLPVGADLVVMDNQSSSDYLRLASKTLRERIDEAHKIIINEETTEVSSSQGLYICSRAEAPQMIRQTLNSIQVSQEALIASQRQTALH